jgi:hypothetical protein
VIAVAVRPHRRSAREIVEELRDQRGGRPGALDPELVPTDRIMQGWAAGSGSGLPSEKWDDRPKSRAPPLDADTFLVVEGIYVRLPAKYKTLVHSWYRTPVPRSAIARSMGLPRTSVYLEWRSVLWYLRGRLHGAGVDC